MEAEPFQKQRLDFQQRLRTLFAGFFNRRNQALRREVFGYDNKLAQLKIKVDVKLLLPKWFLLLVAVLLDL